jgi:hypothetical protein
MLISRNWQFSCSVLLMHGLLKLTSTSSLPLQILYLNYSGYARHLDSHGWYGFIFRLEFR